MAKIKYSVSRTSGPDLVSQARVAAMRLAPEPPKEVPIPGLESRLESLQAAADTAEAALDAYEAKRAELDAAKAARDAAVDRLRREHLVTIGVCEAHAAGDMSILAKTGYPTAADSTFSAPGKVLNLAITWSEQDGCVDGMHDPIAEAQSYDVHISDTEADGPYRAALNPSTSSWTITDLESGQRVWVKVRAIGAVGAGPWSDVATRIVP